MRSEPSRPYLSGIRRGRIYPEEPQPTLGRGALFGEGILIGERTHPCDVVSDEPLRVIAIISGGFVRFANRLGSGARRLCTELTWKELEDRAAHCADVGEESRGQRRAAAAAEVLTLDSTSPTRSGSPPLRPTTAADVTEHSEAIRHLKRRSAETTKFLMDVSNRRVLRPPHTVRGEVNAPVGMRPSNATMPNGEELLNADDGVERPCAGTEAAPTFARVRPAPSEASAPL